MYRFLVVPLAPTLLSALLALACGGCTGAGTERYIPDEKAARTALETALSAWKNGEPYGRIASVSPPVQVLDTQWQAGQKLAGFQVLKEEQEKGNGPRWFTVRLTMQKPAGEVTVRYIVFGNSPLYVYREQDYKKTSGTM
jgi:hypothetical protein